MGDQLFLSLSFLSWGLGKGGGGVGVNYLEWVDLGEVCFMIKTSTKDKIFKISTSIKVARFLSL